MHFYGHYIWMTVVFGCHSSQYIIIFITRRNGVIKPDSISYSSKIFIKIFATSFEWLMISSFSHIIMSLLDLHLLFKNGLIVGHKCWLFGPPSQRSSKYLRCDDSLNLTHLFRIRLKFSGFGFLFSRFRIILRWYCSLRNSAFIYGAFFGVLFSFSSDNASRWWWQGIHKRYLYTH